MTNVIVPRRHAPWCRCGTNGKGPLTIGPAVVHGSTRPHASEENPDARFSQDGRQLGFDTTVGSTPLYSAIANFGAERPDKGEVAVHHCRNHPDPTPLEALGRFTVTTKPGKVKATIKGISIVLNDGLLHAQHGTCKWKLTRTSPADPGVTRRHAVSPCRAAPPRRTSPT